MVTRDRSWRRSRGAVSRPPGLRGLSRHAQGVAWNLGCDGAHSAVRRLAGVDFVGRQYETHILLADVRLAQPPQEAMFARTSSEGSVLVVPFGEGWFRAIAWDRRREQVPLDEPLPMAEMRDAFARIAGTDLGMRDLRWSSRFLSERRQAQHYRVDRVFLAGDAAHVHSPIGGQGMNTGIQDAMNLGWKLAGAVHGWAPPWLLDSYEQERHPVAARVLALTDTFNRLVLGRSPARRALQSTVIRLLLRLPRTRAAMAGRLTGIGIAYPAQDRAAHPWTGRRAPDLTCDSGRLYEALREGGFVLVDATPAGMGPESVPDGLPRIRTVRCRPTAPPGLPAVLLVRPDGYVAWAGTDATEVRHATAQWRHSGTEVRHGP
jgi:hypothetical protein